MKSTDAAWRSPYRALTGPFHLGRPGRGIGPGLQRPLDLAQARGGPGLPEGSRDARMLIPIPVVFFCKTVLNYIRLPDELIGQAPRTVRLVPPSPRPLDGLLLEEQVRRGAGTVTSDLSTSNPPSVHAAYLVRDTDSVSLALFFTMPVRAAGLHDPAGLRGGPGGRQEDSSERGEPKILARSITGSKSRCRAASSKAFNYEAARRVDHENNSWSR